MNSTLLFWEALTFVVLMAVFLPILPRINRSLRRLRGLLDDTEGSRDAMSALDRRYASGEEITREEYLNIRGDITRNPDA